MTTRRWIQHPVTGKLIPREEYTAPRTASGPTILPDIEPFKSPIDGRMITSRSKLEAHNREHSVTNSADYSPQWLANRRKQLENSQTAQARRDRVETIQRSIHTLENS